MHLKYLTTSNFKETTCCIRRTWPSHGCTLQLCSVFSNGHTLHTNCCSFYLPRKDGSQSQTCLLWGFEPRTSCTYEWTFFGAANNSTNSASQTDKCRLALFTDFWNVPIIIIVYYLKQTVQQHCIDWTKHKSQNYNCGVNLAYYCNRCTISVFMMIIIRIRWT